LAFLLSELCQRLHAWQNIVAKTTEILIDFSKNIGELRF
jgi:hypothetical protein